MPELPPRLALTIDVPEVRREHDGALPYGHVTVSIGHPGTSHVFLDVTEEQAWWLARVFLDPSRLPS